MNSKNQIMMSRRANGLVVIDVEGVIGVPEDWQFENDDKRVATYEKFRRTLESIKAIDARDVRVNIRSRGGSVEDALLIYEALCSLSARIETVCHGYVASAATVIAQAGDVRKVSNGTLYLVHRATMTVDGNSAEIMTASALLNKTDERIAQLYADRSGMPVEEFRELMSRDSGRGEWLSPEEVVAAGLADEVVEVSPIAKWGRRIRNMINPRMEISDVVKQETEVMNIEVDESRQVFEMSKRQKEVRQTMTLPKEDPVVGAVERCDDGNKGSYNQDVEVLRAAAL